MDLPKAIEFDYDLRVTEYSIDSASVSLSWPYDMQGTEAHVSWVTLGYASLHVL